MDAEASLLQGATRFARPAVLRLRGLPFDATRKDVATFFRADGVEPRDVFFAPRAGRPSGEGFVVFSDSKRAENAKDANHKREMKIYGRKARWIDVFEGTLTEAAARSRLGLAAARFGDSTDGGYVLGSAREPTSGTRNAPKFRRDVQEHPRAQRNLHLDVFWVPRRFG